MIRGTDSVSTSSDSGESEEKECHSYSPPQFQKRAKARENILLLEERLQHFVEWLDSKGFSVIGDDGEMPVSRERMYLLVMEYVES